MKSFISQDRTALIQFFLECVEELRKRQLIGRDEKTGTEIYKVDTKVEEILAKLEPLQST